MRDDERKLIGEIGDLLEELRARWRDPSRQRQVYVTAGEVDAVNAAEQLANPALLSTLEELESERRRIHGLLMDGQLTDTNEIQALAAKVERLRQDFSVQSA
jgi:hypothetical protein